MDSQQGGSVIGLLFGLVIQLSIAAAIIAGAWKVFTKANQPGWACLVPIYNQYVMTTQIVGRPMLWFLLAFVPCVNLYVAWVVTQELAKSFGKSSGFGVGLFLLAPIFIPMLGFGDAQYSGPSYKGP